MAMAVEPGRYLDVFVTRRTTMRKVTAPPLPVLPPIALWPSTANVARRRLSNGHDDFSESVLRLQQGLQSFRSMRRMDASFKNARALRLRFSQSLARRRQRLS